MELATLNCAFSVELRATAPKPTNNRLPYPIRQQLPEYPLKMRLIAASGVVTLDTAIIRDGKLSIRRVVTATNKLFEAAAREAIKKWRFDCKRYEMEEGPIEMQYTLEFHVLVPD
jgi:TonB family protein